jgi:hypothetical protein
MLLQTTFPGPPPLDPTTWAFRYTRTASKSTNLIRRNRRIENSYTTLYKPHWNPPYPDHPYFNRLIVSVIGEYWRNNQFQQNWAAWAAAKTITNYHMQARTLPVEQYFARNFVYFTQANALPGNPSATQFPRLIPNAFFDPGPTVDPGYAAPTVSNVHLTRDGVLTLSFKPDYDYFYVTALICISDPRTHPRGGTPRYYVGLWLSFFGFAGTVNVQKQLPIRTPLPRARVTVAVTLLSNFPPSTDTGFASGLVS